MDTFLPPQLTGGQSLCVSDFQILVNFIARYHLTTANSRSFVMERLKIQGKGVKRMKIFLRMGGGRENKTKIGLNPLILKFSNLTYLIATKILNKIIKA